MGMITRYRGTDNALNQDFEDLLQRKANEEKTRVKKDRV
ncbi:hypothetical protein D777_02262 [Marinobacter nitratireducens]|uniref:Uncharacterized protein n=1 Tax=Marinobacter nitratireducens TaxID=1137280 RepID=A0A072N0E5_9GAMM|nr:hypothetical protein D777_02262 [Marinobacter nitratireducens]